MSDRYIVVPESLTAHCCFTSTVVDTADGKEDYGDYWKTNVCECIDVKHANEIAESLNITTKIDPLTGEIK